MDIALVDCYDRTGQVIGTKPRADIDRRRDIVPTAYVLVVTRASEMLLARIAEHGDHPRLYTGLLGCPAATMIRHGESADAAAQRALEHDLGITDAVPRFLGKEMAELPDGVVRLIHGFLVTGINAISPTAGEGSVIQRMTRSALEHALHQRSAFAPTFLALWDRYSDRVSFSLFRSYP